MAGWEEIRWWLVEWKAARSWDLQQWEGGGEERRVEGREKGKMDRGSEVELGINKNKLDIDNFYCFYFKHMVRKEEGGGRREEVNVPEWFI